MLYFVTTSGSAVTGGGYSPDGTLPPGAIACTQAQAASAGPWDTIVSGALVVGTPPVAVQTTTSPLAFIQRFTSAEQSALMAANPLWGVLIAAVPVIDTTNALLIADMQAAVTAGTLTQARMTQVLNLSVTSP